MRVRQLQEPARPGTAFPAQIMIVFFPTYARRSPDARGWRVTVAGMVVRPLPVGSRRRGLAVAVLRRILELDEAEIASDVFRTRADAFLFQRVPGQRVRVAFGDRAVEAGISDRSGHFSTEIAVDDDLVERLTASAPGDGGRLEYSGLPADDDDGIPVGGGTVHLVENAGVSLISDIDDTVKVTNVANRRELLRNTFVREFTAVSGMAEIYRRYQAAGTAFHYVSASPWQLSACLCGFLGAAGLPAGSMHLKLFRLKDSTPLGRFPSRKRAKRRAIERIMDDFPDRRFLLVGDSGERDPEVYVDVARRRPDQVHGILIRRLDDGHTPAATLDRRLARLGRRLPVFG
jgi:phosphatidate phosphatase APP1